jgi:methylmalonyl-CoA mutase
LTDPRPASSPSASPSAAPFRVLTAVALADGHDAAIVAVNRALRRRGFEVIYIGFNKGVRAIVDAAIQEDADAIGLSSYNGGHMEFIDETLKLLRERGSKIPLVAGGGGTITPGDETELLRMGVADVFPPGTPLPQVAERVEKLCAARRQPLPAHLHDLAGGIAAGDALALARALTLADSPAAAQSEALQASFDGLPRRDPEPFVVGVSGYGGAGKSTLIDELILRRLKTHPEARVAVLCCDPSASAPLPGQSEIGGALLGDRIRMLSAESDRVFIRSLATRGRSGGESESIARALQVLRAAPFDLVLLESAGIGQADAPFAGLVDLSLYVMTSEFGSALQLEKIAMLERSDIVALNKCDNPASLAALKSIKARLRAEATPEKPAPALLGVSAVVHKDAGMDALAETIATRQRERSALGR